MSKMKRLHLGNGTVYLENWINIDLSGSLAKDNPAMVERNKTTVENYYKFPFRQNKDNNVTDIIMDVRKLEFDDNSIDRILCVNLIDHMKKEEFIDALKDWHRVLKTGGELIIDVDDRQKQAEILTSAETNEEIEWALRLIYCDHAREGRTHWWGYTPKYLKQLLENNGFEFCWKRTDYIVHDMYPNFQISVTKK
ncbi:MAG: methyltransferase domain-containing protein [Bacilli bacterium]|jgi:SAM-dependent methyltransferase